MNFKVFCGEKIKEAVKYCGHRKFKGSVYRPAINELFKSDFRYKFRNFIRLIWNFIVINDILILGEKYL